MDRSPPQWSMSTRSSSSRNRSSYLLNRIVAERFCSNLVPELQVNTAGTAIPKKSEETTLEEMDRMIDINIRGAFAATQAALKHMKDGVRIIMIGSCVRVRMMTPGLMPCSATKGAVKMFTQG